MSACKIIPLLSLGCLLLLGSCGEETLEITPDEGQTSSAYPAFNFNIESLSSSDTISLGNTITYNLYLRQQLTYVEGRKYFVSFSLPQAYDGEAFIYQVPCRSGDLMLIDYKQVVKDNFRVSVSFRPLHKNKGSYQISFTCKDEGGKTQNFAKYLIVE